MTAPLSPDAVRRELAARGISISAWADKNGFTASQVYAALSGRTRGLRGRSAEVAQALGIAERPDKTGRFSFLD